MRHYIHKEKYNIYIQFSDTIDSWIWILVKWKERNSSKTCKYAN